MAKTIEIKVFTTDHKGFEKFVFRPVTPNCEYSPAGMQHVIGQMLAELTKSYPDNTFKVVPIGANKFNILPDLISNA